MPALLSVEIVWIGAKPLMGRMTRPAAKRARHDMAGRQVQDGEVLLFLLAMAFADSISPAMRFG
ncbi:hypothetical protein CKA34_08665 [Rhizobium sp. 11515TR]|nr:hypothetical protein CKA34_08665 [Rhizobium sp. 11515TR]